MLVDVSPPFQAQYSPLDARPRHNEDSTDCALGDQGSGHSCTLNREIFATNRTLECSCRCVSILPCVRHCTRRHQNGSNLKLLDVQTLCWVPESLLT